jgi:hypothetical protein
MLQALCHAKGCALMMQKCFYFPYPRTASFSDPCSAAPLLVLLRCRSGGGGCRVDAVQRLSDVLWPVSLRERIEEQHDPKEYRCDDDHRCQPAEYPDANCQEIDHPSCAPLHTSRHATRAHGRPGHVPGRQQGEQRACCNRRAPAPQVNIPVHRVLVPHSRAALPCSCPLAVRAFHGPCPLMLSSVSVLLTRKCQRDRGCRSRLTGNDVPSSGWGDVWVTIPCRVTPSCGCLPVCCLHHLPIESRDQLGEMQRLDEAKGGVGVEASASSRGRHGSPRATPLCPSALATAAQRIPLGGTAGHPGSPRRPPWLPVPGR